jgi:hypothetical protein
MTFFLSLFATPIKIQNNPITERPRPRPRPRPRKNSSVKINIISGSSYGKDAFCAV